MNNLLEYFDFDTSPFVDSVNPTFFFQTRCHERALLRTQYCIEQKRALGLIWGRSGAGKTLVTQSLMKRMDRTRFEPIVVLCTPNMTMTPLLREIVHEMGVAIPPFRAQALLEMIEQRIMEEYSKGRRMVILADEAHFLSSNALHILRTLSNLETSDEKLLTVILSAEEILVQRLKHPRYASLRGRIAIETEIPPLTPEETEQYVQFRLMVAGGAADLFTPECYPLIFQHTKGVPREISKLADNALLEAYMAGRRIIEPEMIEAVVEGRSIPRAESANRGIGDSEMKGLRLGLSS